MPTSKRKKPLMVFITSDPVDGLLDVRLYNDIYNDYVVVCRKVFESIFGKIRVNHEYILTGTATLVPKKR